MITIELEGLECVLSHVTHNDYGKSKWYQHVNKNTARSHSGECFVVVFLAFSKFSQISCIYFGDRVTASNLKSFMMDLAVIVAELRKSVGLS